MSRSKEKERAETTRRILQVSNIAQVLLLGVAVLFPACSTSQQVPAGFEVSCSIYPSIPSAFDTTDPGSCQFQDNGSRISISNRYLDTEISTVVGVITEIRNKLTGDLYRIQGDSTGFAVGNGSGPSFSWRAQEDTEHQFETKLHRTEDGAVEVVLAEKYEGLSISLIYRMRPEQFWVERKLLVENQGREVTYEQLDYGRCEVEGSSARELVLGRFDRPRLHTLGNGGLFAGVGWWFYSVSPEGEYQNTNMDYSTCQNFESEPWYVGVFMSEGGEPYPGWLWYRTFLEERKCAYDTLKFSSCWNAGYGQWGIDMDNPDASSFIELVHKLGIRQIGFGGGARHREIPEYIELAKTSEIVQKNLDLCKSHGLSVGFLEPGWLKEKWGDNRVIEAKLKHLDEFVKLGFGTFHFDYFETVDTFTAHRNVTRYFRAAHDKLDYVECHLGMAAYGPQFQREVLVNHPTDLEGFDLSHFSSDWTTFLGFRHSRRQWQKRYHYLMPEYSLYYFATHYANRDHPRLYNDPEPQQLQYKYEPYCGLGYNFHDCFGFRDSVAALSAFSTFYVWGYIDFRIPAAERKFMIRFLKWAEHNSGILRRGRICFEDEKACVVSKLEKGAGAIYLLNYDTGTRLFRFKLQEAGMGANEIREVYPAPGKVLRTNPDEEVEFLVPGESVTILEVNQAFRGVPPSNRIVRQDVQDWRKTKDGWLEDVSLQDEQLSPLPISNPDIPEQILALDQIDDPRDPIVIDIGKGKVPTKLLEELDFEEGQRVATWKLAPWAMSDRVWFIYKPAAPLLLSEVLPKLELNGVRVPLVPRLDYRPKDRSDWNCPIFFADVTDVHRAGRSCSLLLSGIQEPGPGQCYLIWAHN